MKIMRPFSFSTANTKTRTTYLDCSFRSKGARQAGKLGLPYLASPIESFILKSNYAMHAEAMKDEGITVKDSTCDEKHLYLR